MRRLPARPRNAACWRAAHFARGACFPSMLRFRLGRQRDSGAPGFGNAREVRNLVEAAISRQSGRVLAQQRQGGWRAQGLAGVRWVGLRHAQRTHTCNVTLLRCPHTHQCRHRPAARHAAAHA
jgi:hypothetical protein